MRVDSFFRMLALFSLLPPSFMIANEPLRRLTSYASMAVALTLIGVKVYAYVLTSSLALLSSLVDSGIDLLASAITAYGIYIALLPPDRNHRYGHGKAEPLAALVQALFIFASSAFLVKEAIGRFITPVPIQNAEAAYAVMGFSILLTVLLLLLQTYTVRRTQSLAIASDRLHYIGDVLVNTAVIATFALQGVFTLSWIDPAFALVIAAAMSIGAVKITRLSLRVLMDTELDEPERLAIQTLMCGVAGVRGVHDLRTRPDGERLMIEAHVEMDATLSLIEAHDIAEAVEAALIKAYPHADVIIHQDPAGIEEKRRDAEIERNDPIKETPDA